VVIRGVWWPGDLLGHGPHAPHQRTGDGDHDVVGMVAAGHQSTAACTQSSLGVPAAGLDNFGGLFTPQLEVAPALRGVARGPGAFPKGAAEGTEGLVLDRRHIDRRERPSPHEPGQWHGSTAVGFALGPSLVGSEGGRDAPTGLAFSAAIAREPGAPRPRFGAKDPVCSLGVARADALVAVTRACAEGPEADHLGGRVLGHGGHGDGRLMDSQADRARVRLGPGCPPRAWEIAPGTVHEAALAAGKLTRVRPGGQPTHRKSLCLDPRDKETPPLTSRSVL
jgi:hypothetical protein